MLIVMAKYSATIPNESMMAPEKNETIINREVQPWTGTFPKILSYNAMMEVIKAIINEKKPNKVINLKGLVPEVKINRQKWLINLE